MSEPLKLALTDYRTVLLVALMASVARTKEHKVSVTNMLVETLGDEPAIRGISYTADLVLRVKSGETPEVPENLPLEARIVTAVMFLMHKYLQQDKKKVSEILSGLANHLLLDSGLDPEVFNEISSVPGVFHLGKES